MHEHSVGTCPVWHSDFQTSACASIGFLDAHVGRVPIHTAENEKLVPYSRIQITSF